MRVGVTLYNKGDSKTEEPFWQQKGEICVIMVSNGEGWEIHWKENLHKLLPSIGMKSWAPYDIQYPWRTARQQHRVCLDDGTVDNFDHRNLNRNAYPLGPSEATMIVCGEIIVGINGQSFNDEFVDGAFKYAREQCE